MSIRVKQTVDIAQELCGFFSELFLEDLLVCNAGENNDVLIPLLQNRLWVEELGWRDIYIANGDGRYLLELDDETWLFFTQSNTVECCLKDQLWEFTGSNDVTEWEIEFKDGVYNLDMGKLTWLDHYLVESDTMDYNWGTALRCLFSFPVQGYVPTRYNRRVVNGLLDIKIPLQAAIGELTEYAFGYAYDDSDLDGESAATVVGSAINNGLCHVFGKLAQAYLASLGIRVELLGSPTHVLLGTIDRWYDFNWPIGTELSAITRWPEDMLIEYDGWQVLLEEFPTIPEAAGVVTNALEIAVGVDSPIYEIWLNEIKSLETFLAQ